jgi:hypothetical protein
MGMRRVGHLGFACAVVVFALVVPPAAYATTTAGEKAIGVPDVAASSHRAAAPTAARFVAYNGVGVTVPASWQVIDLRLHPRTCLRLDRAAVYLGSPGSQSDCPAHAVGRADTIWLRTATTGQQDTLTSHDTNVGALAARVGVNPLGHDKQIQFVAQGVELEATWGADSSSIDHVLASAVRAPGPYTPAMPATPSSASPGPGGLAPPARQQVSPGGSPGAGTSALAAASTFTGMAFDTCGAPSVSTMRAWLASPYRAVGIYIGGSQRACGDGNLSASWTAQVRSMGWGLLPLYVGLQAPCVDQSGVGTIAASQASAQGTASAVDAVSRAKFFGLASGSPIYFDMEQYNRSAAGCSRTVMSFISAWTAGLHRLGYKSGAYGSTSSLMLDMSASATSAGFVAPDNVWFANWNQLQTTSDSRSYPGFPDAYWRNHQRVHQYDGGSTQGWGGVAVNIDASWVDAAVAGTAVPVNYGTNVVGPGGSGFIFTGSMAYWRSGAPAGLKRLAYWTYSNGSTESNGATWSPQLAAGRYNVEANIPSTNATGKARYTIRDALGTTTKVVSQQSLNGYTSLGTFTAQAGRPISVHVGDNGTSSTSTKIGVDAMAFRPVSTAPGAPTGVSATAGNAQAAVSWTAPASNGGSAITRYTVTAAPGGRTATTTGATTATVTGLTNGTAYRFTATATNAAGTSPGSTASAAVTPRAQEAGFTGAAPARVLDTRIGLGAPKAKLGAGRSLTLTVPGLPAGTTAVALNVTVTNPTAAGHLTVYPGGQPLPGVSNLNYVPGQTIPNMVVVPLGPGNTVTFYNSAGTVDVIADVLGHYAPGTGAEFTGRTPTRVLDTRIGLGAPKAKLGAGRALTLTVPALPAGTTAVALNVTVTNPTAAGHLTVYPGGQPLPGVSNLNYVPGQTIPNMVVVPLGPGNTVTFYNSAGTVDVIADVLGSYS